MPARNKRGSLRQRGNGTWQYREGSVTFTVEATSERSARKKADERLQDMGRDIGDSPRFDHYWERWIALKEAENRSPTTIDGYRSKADSQLLPFFGKKKLKAIDKHDLNRFWLHLQEAGRAPGTVRHYRRILNAMFNQAIKWDLLSLNPIAKADIPPDSDDAVEAPPNSDVARFLEAARDFNSERGILTFFSLTAILGTRLGETIGLQLRDIDREKMVVHIRRNIYDVGDGPKAKAPKTKAGKREIEIDDAVLSLIDIHVARLSERVHGTYPARGYLFSSDIKGTTPWRPEYPSHVQKKLRDQAGVEFTTHGLRHYSATALLMAGVPIHVVQKRLGHSTPMVTLNIYGHATDEASRNAAELAGGLITNSS